MQKRKKALKLLAIKEKCRTFAKIKKSVNHLQL